MQADKHEQHVQAINSGLSNGSPAEISLAMDDIAWLVANDPDKRSQSFHISKSFREGAKGQRRSIQYTIDANRRKRAEQESEKNEESFTKYVLANPEVTRDLTKLLQLAATYKIPTNIVLEIHGKATQAAALNAAKTSSTASTASAATKAA